MSYDRLAPTVSSKAKKSFGSGNMGQNNWGGAVPLLDGLDTRPCKILDPRVDRYDLWKAVVSSEDTHTHAGPIAVAGPLDISRPGTSSSSSSSSSNFL